MKSAYLLVLVILLGLTYNVLNHKEPETPWEKEIQRQIDDGKIL